MPIQYPPSWKGHIRPKLWNKSAILKPPLLSFLPLLFALSRRRHICALLLLEMTHVELQYGDPQPLQASCKFFPSSPLSSLCAHIQSNIIPTVVLRVVVSYMFGILHFVQSCALAPNECCSVSQFSQRSVGLQVAPLKDEVQKEFGVVQVLRSDV